MKKRIVWFIAGFIVSWLTWSTVAHIRQRPGDFTEVVFTDNLAFAPHWLKKAKGRNLGQFMVVTPADPAKNAAYIYPSAPNHYPFIMIEDDIDSGRLGSVTIVDSASQYVVLEYKASDNEFDSLTFSRTRGKESVMFSDNNMDGQYDIKVGPERTLTVAIKGQWYELIRTPESDSEKMSQSVKINGKLTEVKAVAGVWEVIQDN